MPLRIYSGCGSLGIHFSRIGLSAIFGHCTTFLPSLNELVGIGSVFLTMFMYTKKKQGSVPYFRPSFRILLTGPIPLLLVCKVMLTYLSLYKCLKYLCHLMLTSHYGSLYFWSTVLPCIEKYLSIFSWLICLLITCCNQLTVSILIPIWILLGPLTY